MLKPVSGSAFLRSSVKYPSGCHHTNRRSVQSHSSISRGRHACHDSHIPECRARDSRAIDKNGNVSLQFLTSGPSHHYPCVFPIPLLILCFPTPGEQSHSGQCIITSQHELAIWQPAWPTAVKRESLVTTRPAIRARGAIQASVNTGHGGKKGKHTVQTNDFSHGVESKMDVSDNPEREKRDLIGSREGQERERKSRGRTKK